MKKIAIASLLALAAMTASAQTTVYGNLRAFVDSKTTSGTTVNSMISDQSRLGITTTEQLGGGLTARATLETSIAVTDPKVGADTKLGDRTATVGLATSTSSVDLGRKFNSHYLALSGSDSFGALYGTINGDIHNLRTIRSGDAVFVSTKLGPVTVSADRTLTAGVTPEATSYSLSTALGPVTGTVARFRQDVETSNVVALVTSFYGTQVSYSYSDNNGTTGNTKGNLVGVKRQLGNSPVTLKAGYGTKTGDVKAYNIGADYALSQRTGISVAYKNVDASTDVRQFGIGLTHKF